MLLVDGGRRVMTSGHDSAIRIDLAAEQVELELVGHVAAEGVAPSHHALHLRHRVRQRGDGG